MNENDYIVEVFRAGFTLPSLRVTHKPSGLVAFRDDVQNTLLARIECLAELQERLDD